MNAKQAQLKPQDILILLMLLVWKGAKPWRYSDLAKNLRMSQSEVHQAIKRSQLSGLYDPLTKRPKRQALIEFIIHGLKYAFPAIIGDSVEGVPTAHSAPPLNNQIISHDEMSYVWPWKGEKLKGKKVAPLHKNVPIVAKSFPEMYPLLALIDALRVGRAREREMAEKELSERIMSA